MPVGALILDDGFLKFWIIGETLDHNPVEIQLDDVSPALGTLAHISRHVLED